MLLKNNIFLVLLTSGILFSCGTESPQSENTKVEDYVDPMIGTDYHAHTYPGATNPFGMVQLSPENGRSGWDWTSGYHYSDSLIAGFSHTHLSGTGIGDLNDILVSPVINKVDLNKSRAGKRDTYDYVNKFSHDNEIAEAGYYSVIMDNGIKAEMTTSPRMGYHRYTFPKDEQQQIVVDLAHAINWDWPKETAIEIVDDRTIKGVRVSSGWVDHQSVYFYAQFSKPFVSYELALDSTSVSDQSTNLEGQMVRGLFAFDNSSNEPIVMKLALSSSSTDGAKLNFEAESGHSFDDQVAENKLAWREQLGKIKVKGGTESLKKVFYTALYHSTTAPALYSDVDGKFEGGDQQVHKTHKGDQYSTFSLWDTFRAVHPLLTIINPEKVNDMVRSLVHSYETTGKLPVWGLAGGDTGCMWGYHAVSVIGEAYLKGFRDYDVEKAYEAMMASVMQDIRFTDLYKQYGYIPFDLTNQSVSKTQEYCYGDWVLAQVAKDLGKMDDYEMLMKRSDYWKNLYDDTTGFMRAKDTKGNWREPFDPISYGGHDHENPVKDYIEGNAWQYVWYELHDIPTLIDTMGGADVFVAKLDKLFELPSDAGDASSDITGLIGQYVHGNEPSHHVAYLYNYAGYPWKTQEKARGIMETMYTDQPDGIAGNEDCGQMSAWYVMSAIGLYPVTPALAQYQIGSPVFEEAVISNADGSEFVIEAKNNSDQNIYIQSARLNGKNLDRSYLTHSEIAKGGKLELVMGSKPNKSLFK
ncbi:GH92 family glycosyl hydrolase [Aureibacter tunicatorum]|uniref:Alpha-1,2-mannosidase n=1 Tax=Aureibacter tunicatorum TaxID=866807 RepID=A0AAE3XL39_9BACT|nr:GH92 family glycosyl hydrolase [Aureibacter tunicatorum]MDR6237751.1 putative alpha-1,2-mannosidase [Aureibacter tunicatorum]BDD02786.1 alpha-1 2-mannosidase [Aureibacter tunicatorum]